MEPCLPLGNSLFGHHNDPVLQPLINDYTEALPEDHAKQVKCTLAVTGAISKLSIPRKLIAVTAKFFTCDSHAKVYAFGVLPHNFHGKQLLVDSIGGEESSAANPCIKLAGHTDLVSLQFDPGGHLLGGFVFDLGGSYSHGFTMSTSALSSL